MALVTANVDRLDAAFDHGDARRPPAPGVWSPGEYRWHLVDVLTIGRERLWTVAIDAANGMPAWDENDLARVRRYDALSSAVGRQARRVAAEAWTAAAVAAPADVGSRDAEVGMVSASDVIRTNAHEVRHHLLDVRHGLDPDG